MTSRASTAAIAVLAIAGCGSSKSGIDPETFAERYCALFAPCCADVGVSAGGAGCSSVIVNNARLVGRTGELGEACLADLKARFDSFGFCNFSASSVPSCDKVLGQVTSVPSGTIAPGGECTGTPSCAPGTRGATTCTFDTSGASTVLRCQEQIPGGASGEGPCIATLFENDALFSNNITFYGSGVTCAVADGLYCDPAAGICVPRRQVGEACNDTDVALAVCTTGLCVSSQCAPTVPAGGSCASGVCADKTFCDATTTTCTAVRPVGATCTSFSDCALNICENGVCSPAWNAGALGFLCGP